MKRVLVIGSCGAGKSTLSRELQKITGLPLIHLDRQYWNPGWVEPEKADWLGQVNDFINGDEWIIDGNYGGSMTQRMTRADTVIWLDLPRYVCIYRVLKRVFFGNARADMAEGCEERFDLEFIKYVWNFRRDKNPEIEARLKSNEKSLEIHKLSNRREVTSFFDEFDGGSKLH